MKNTGIYKSDLHLEHEAKGYNKTEKGYEPALNWDMSWAGGAGAMYSTVEDLNKWNDALFNGKVLSGKSFKAAFTPVLLNNGSKPPGVDYGYGWSISNYRGIEMLGHSGGLHGFISQLARYTPDNFTVVMLTNQLPVEVELDPNKIAEIFLWQRYYFVRRKDLCTGQQHIRKLGGCIGPGYLQVFYMDYLSGWS